MTFPVDTARTAVDWKNSKCGSCEYWIEIQVANLLIGSGNQKFGECKEGPPDAHLVNIDSSTGPQFAVGYKRLPASHSACSRFEKTLI